MSDAKTVLIVDDEIDTIDIMNAMLSDIEGIVTISTQDPDAVLETAKTQNPALIMLDVQMPEKSGFDVFAELQKDAATASIPVVMVTGVAEKTGLPFSAEDMQEFLGSEPAAYLEKPVDAATLQATVSRVLGV
jgi:CheY-like chemotaxis protein